MAENKENIPKERFVPGALRRMNAAIGPEGFNLTPYDNSIIELKGKTIDLNYIKIMKMY